MRSRHSVYMYVVGLLVGGVFGWWAGLSPLFLVILLGCPLMMVCMMRGGMRSSPGESDAAGGGGELLLRMSRRTAPDRLPDDRMATSP